MDIFLRCVFYVIKTSNPHSSVTSELAKHRSHTHHPRQAAHLIQILPWLVGSERLSLLHPDAVRTGGRLFHVSFLLGIFLFVFSEFSIPTGRHRGYRVRAKSAFMM